MVLLKRRQKYLQKRELAESIEDAKIFASSRQLDPSQNIMMRPLDQVNYKHVSVGQSHPEYSGWSILELSAAYWSILKHSKAL